MKVGLKMLVPHGFGSTRGSTLPGFGDRKDGSAGIQPSFLGFTSFAMFCLMPTSATSENQVTHIYIYMYTMDK